MENRGWLPHVGVSAYMLAREAHKGQTDMAGKPYIGHCARVARRVSGETAKAVAWLHDVVEDTDVTLDDLRVMGFPDAVVDAVDAVTQRRDADGVYEPLDEYWARVKANPIALRVKLADIADNNDPARQAWLPTERQMKLRSKYARALEFLGS